MMAYRAERERKRQVNVKGGREGEGGEKACQRRLVTADAEGERKILAADSCRGSAGRAVKASQPDPQEKHGGV
jgi:hypothetical protein